MSPNLASSPAHALFASRTEFMTEHPTPNTESASLPGTAHSAPVFTPSRPSHRHARHGPLFRTSHSAPITVIVSLPLDANHQLWATPGYGRRPVMGAARLWQIPVRKLGVMGVSPVCRERHPFSRYPRGGLFGIPMRNPATLGTNY